MSYLQRKEAFGFFCLLTKETRSKALALRNALEFGSLKRTKTSPLGTWLSSIANDYSTATL